MLLKATKLSSNCKMIDVQHSTRYKGLIKEAVQHSPLSKATFKHKHLRHQRNNIEHSNTLHDLRMNCTLLIGPLSMLYEHEAIQDGFVDDELISIDSLCKELSIVQASANERQRIIDEMMTGYNETFNTTLTGCALVLAIDKYKALHSATDMEACRVFKVGRTTLNRHRKDRERYMVEMLSDCP